MSRPVFIVSCVVLAMLIGYGAGLLRPRASAADTYGTIVAELRGIRAELHDLNGKLRR